jgi:hypothetical protein
MASTKKVLTSLHGRRVGIDAAGNLIINGRTIPSQNDTGALKIIQTAPNAVNATATLTAAQLLAGIITSTTAAAVNGTLPTGTLLDAADNLAIDDAFEWVVINTGAANAFTIAGDTGHTIVGNAAVALSSSGRFLTRKTAANTFVTYRV